MCRQQSSRGDVGLQSHLTPSHRTIPTPTRLARPCVCVLALLAIFAAATGGCRHEPEDDAEPATEVTVGRPRPEPEIATVRFAERRFTVCRVDLTTHSLELFWRDEAGKPFRSFSALDAWLRERGRKLVFAMNAGMYLEDSSPVGLYVEHGEQLRPLNLARGRSNFCLRPNGVFAITDSGAVVVESSTYPTIKPSTSLATQSGPMLVIDGQLHPAFGANSKSRLIRNGVGVVSAEEVVFAISEDPVNFHEFATFFRDELQCENALFLDGTISSLYSTALDRNDMKTSLGPIIAVTAEF